MMLETFSQPGCQRLSMTLAHFLWQGTLIALALWCVRRWFPARRATTRYAFALAALAMMALAPVVTFSMCILPVSEPGLIASGNASTTSEMVVMPEGETALATAAVVSAETTRPAYLNLSYLRQLQPYLLLAWLCGVTLLGLRLLCSYLETLRLRRERIEIPRDLARRARGIGERLGIATAGRIFASRRIAEATAVGFWRPIVLLPLAWVTELPPGVLEAVISHELAHIRRGDLWINLVQRLVETLLFYHPAVWWVSRQVRLEREMCCDELAVATTGERIGYVKALELVARRHQSLADPALVASFRGERRMNLLQRVRNVLGAGPACERGRWWPVGIAALALPLAIWSTSLGIVPTQSAIALADDDRKEREGDRPAEKREESKEGERQEGERRDGEWREGERDGDRPRPEANRERRDRERRDRERREGDRRERRADERRDGDRPAGERREGPRDVERREGERRDGDRPAGERREGPRDGERREGDRRDAPREGERREGDRREGDRPRPDFRGPPREGERRDGDRPRPEFRGPRDGERPPFRGEFREGERRPPEGDFRGPPPRDPELIRLIQELREEVMRLRREVEQLRESRPPAGPPRDRNVK